MMSPPLCHVSRMSICLVSLQWCLMTGEQGAGDAAGPGRPGGRAEAAAGGRTRKWSPQDIAGPDVSARCSSAGLRGCWRRKWPRGCPHGAQLRWTQWAEMHVLLRTVVCALVWLQHLQCQSRTVLTVWLPEHTGDRCTPKLPPRRRPMASCQRTAASGRRRVDRLRRMHAPRRRHAPRQRPPQRSPQLLQRRPDPSRRTRQARRPLQQLRRAGRRKGEGGCCPLRSRHPRYRCG